MNRVRIGLVGIGKIARDQHIPVIRANGVFDLAATVSGHSKLDGIPNFSTVGEMLKSDLVDAVSICTPPQHHFEAAHASLMAGKHVLLEKPPCQTTLELDLLAVLAADKRCTLFQTWHSRFAPEVDTAAEILLAREIIRVSIMWKEDVRLWHPGQSWIFRAGGFGVFDPGINALSILTKILTDSVTIKTADLFIPENCEAPIAADLRLETQKGAPITAAFDFRHTGTQTWDIRIETNHGDIVLSQGGSVLSVDGKPFGPTPVDADKHAEYAPLYAHFAALVRHRESDVDARPFRLVSDAFLVGRRVTVEAFQE
jgi:D-galactose 1-dehydrogenase